VDTYLQHHLYAFKMAESSPPDSIIIVVVQSTIPFSTWLVVHPIYLLINFLIIIRAINYTNLQSGTYSPRHVLHTQFFLIF